MENLSYTLGKADERGDDVYISDLHIHSRYSMATSKDCIPEAIDLWARRKGLALVGTGDFTHPAWRRELAEKLQPDGSGFYTLKEEYFTDEIREYPDPDGGNAPKFAVTGEISSIYKKYGRTRKIHNLIILPGLEDAEKISRRLEKIGNIHSDGRPILGLDARDLLELVLDVSPEAVFVPAHIWTPHFSLFGAFSGFDTVEECFEDMSPYIHAAETGLSSDPPMNRLVSSLDSMQLISNSDAHSPSKLGREATIFNGEFSYQGLRKSIQTGEGLSRTIEFFPEEGKYYLDGHRKCGICLTPEETKKYNGICPVCGRKITIGVMHRVRQLADRENNDPAINKKPYESLVPLPEILAASLGYSSSSKRVRREYMRLLHLLGTEFDILRNVPGEDLCRLAGERTGRAILKLREDKVEKIPGFDGKYGQIRFFFEEDGSAGGLDFPTIDNQGPIH